MTRDEEEAVKCLEEASKHSVGWTMEFSRALLSDFKGRHPTRAKHLLEDVLDRHPNNAAAKFELDSLSTFGKW